MRYVTYELAGERRIGRIEGDLVQPLEGPAELGRDTPADVLATLVPMGAPVARASVRLLPVVPRPDKIFCVGLNYHAHVEETGRELPAYPVLFTKFTGSLIGPADDIVLPPESRQVDYEAELVVVIGKAGRRIARDAALDHVLGYTVANDVTMRDFQYKTHQWLQGKAWDRSTPLGPELVTPDEADVAAATVRTVLNGETLQSSDTSKLIFDIPTLVATVSEFTEILPGDLILTGTPGGVGHRRDPQVFLLDGDEVVVEVGGIGRLANRVRAEAPALVTSPAWSA
ncbi:fumarylacetoacetate hydrolase family protein [Amycolatopsis sp. CA-126428]|uniref:fumarylacetoacetate hydrolase family protein n=1 Tax=Amycolatopsis sp. CA-126428 TaxID=2073158 RepID=UPI000CD0A988|nr:fumarylacetoacetate hydrolase family protein [Amycolatopsis sp. CA-126428]